MPACSAVARAPPWGVHHPASWPSPGVSSPPGFPPEGWPPVRVPRCRSWDDPRGARYSEAGA
eukprot:13353807-Alexandrium_andersonii.AAC.1